MVQVQLKLFQYTLDSTSESGEHHPFVIIAQESKDSVFEAANNYIQDLNRSRQHDCLGNIRLKSCKLVQALPHVVDTLPPIHK